MGDLNCDLLAKRSIPTECKHLKSLFRFLNFSQLITKLTGIAQTSKTLLDLIAMTCPQNISGSGVISSNLSDHEMVFCVRKLNWMTAPAQTKVFRNYANYDPMKFCQELRGVDWNAPINHSGATHNHPHCVLTITHHLFKNAYEA